MARITFQDFNNVFDTKGGYDIINAIRDEDPNFAQYVPEATAENIAEVGAGVLLSPTTQNAFITPLVDRISIVVVRHKMLYNDFSRFKKGMMPLGRKIEEIYTDIATEYLYDPEESEETVFKREIPDTKVLFHELNRQSRYKQTIQDASLRAAFVSWDAFESFTASIIQAIYNANAVDEYKKTKLLLDNYYMKNLFKNVVVPDPLASTSFAEEFIKRAREYYRKITLGVGSREYNAMGVHTRTDEADVHFFITPELEAHVDVDVLAKSFNMDKTTFLGKTTVIDSFGAPNVKAVMVDSEWFMLYDQLQTMESIRNPEGLYFNYNAHFWQLYSASRFHNAVAFVTEEGEFPPTPISQVIINPMLESLRQGKSKQFRAIIRRTDFTSGTIDNEIVWSVAGNSAGGTTINSDGVLTIATNETSSQLVVTATASYTLEGAEESTNVVQNALVNVQPARNG